MDRHSIRNDKDSPYFDWIVEGYKKYEGRLRKKIKEWNLFVGKEMIFYDESNPDSSVQIRVTNLLEFNDFGEAFDELGSELIPDRTRSEVIELYDDLFGRDVIIEDGVVTIGFIIF